MGGPLINERIRFVEDAAALAGREGPLGGKNPQTSIGGELVERNSGHTPTLYRAVSLSQLVAVMTQGCQVCDSHAHTRRRNHSFSEEVSACTGLSGLSVRC